MYHALVHFPQIDIRRIEQLRRRYDPTVDLIAPHIPLLFPVPDTVSVDALTAHISPIVASWRPFPIHIRGLYQSWDHWLFLTLQEGNREVIRLYHTFYSGILRAYRRTDIEFVPHIGLGLFVTAGAAYATI